MSGEKSGRTCAFSSIKDCSSLGIDSVQVTVVEVGGGEVRVVHPCYVVGEGPLGRGPGLAAGDAVLTVWGRSAGAQPFVGPVELRLTIPDSGLVEGQVTLPRPSQCKDGVDNDGDGLVDQLDPQCASAAGATLEGTARCADGLDNDGDKLTDLSDPDCADATGNSERADGC